MAGDFVQPTDFSVRSPIYRALLAEDARFRAVGNTAVAVDYGHDGEAERLKSLGLVDLSPLPRTGFKGTGMLTWARHRDLAIPEENNRAQMQADGSLIARLADNEILVLESLKRPNGICTALEQACLSEAPVNCYPVPRSSSHAWLLVGGHNAPAMFAKLCALDLRTDKFSNGNTAQVIVARIAAIVIRCDVNGDATPAFHLLTDNTSADYLWRCLKDAAQEFNGNAVGYDALSMLL